jgi:hypothetical protein
MPSFVIVEAGTAVSESIGSGASSGLAVLRSGVIDPNPGVWRRNQQELVIFGKVAKLGPPWLVDRKSVRNNQRTSPQETDGWRTHV